MLRDTAKHIGYLSRAFPIVSENDDYFANNSYSFDRTRLAAFRARCQSSSSVLLFGRSAAFQKAMVKTWNPNAEEETKSNYLGLVGIDEAPSKECGAITLDLLLRAGVLEENDDGLWVLANDWDTRRIYLYGNAKTIENITKFVCDMQDRRVSY